MEKFWIYLVVLLVGFAGGVIVGVKLMGDQIEIQVRKIKNKRTSGTNQVTIPIEVKEPRKTRVAKRKEKE